MFDIDGRKRSLRALAERLERLRAGVPAPARAFHGDADRLQAAITARLGALALMIKANEVQGLQDRCEALGEFAAGITRVRAEAGQLHEAEQAFATDLAQADDAELNGWFAARGRRRADWLVGAGYDAPDAAALAEHHERLGAYRKDQSQDRRLFDLLAEARQRLNAFGGTGPTQGLADEFAQLRRGLLHDGPTRAWVERLLGLLQSLRTFQPRAKPPLIEEAYELLVRMDDWIKELRDGPAGQPRSRATPRQALNASENALRALTNRYFDLSKDWQQHEDAVFAALLAEAKGLEGQLVARAQAEHAALSAELEPSREMFQQFSDPGLSPGLAEEIADLLSQTPATPDAFRGWRERCRRARERFEAAIDADSHRIEPLGDTLEREIHDRIEQLQHLPLDAEDQARCAEIAAALAAIRRPSAADVRVPELLAWLDELGTLRERAKRLLAAVSAKTRRCERRCRGLRLRVERLRQLALALDEPTGGQFQGLIDAVGQRPAGLAPSRDALEQDRRILTQVQADLLQRCAARLRARREVLVTLHALLDADLAIRTPALHTLSVVGPAPHLRELETLAATLPTIEAAVRQALEQQTERLLDGRTGLLAALTDSDRKGLARPDREAIERIVAALRDCDQTRVADPQLLVSSLRNLLAQGRRLLERVDGTQRALESLTRRLNLRLNRLQDDYFEVERQTTVDRIWALIQPVSGVSSSQLARGAQLAEAARLLGALEEQARRSAAAQFAAHWHRIKDSDDPEAQGLVGEIGGEPFALPSFEHRRRVHELANRNR